MKFEEHRHAFPDPTSNQFSSKFIVIGTYGLPSYIPWFKQVYKNCQEYNIYLLHHLTITLFQWLSSSTLPLHFESIACFFSFQNIVPVFHPDKIEKQGRHSYNKTFVIRKTLIEKRRFARTCCWTNTPFSSKNSKSSIFFYDLVRNQDLIGLK